VERLWATVKYEGGLSQRTSGRWGGPARLEPVFSVLTTSSASIKDAAQKRAFFRQRMKAVNDIFDLQGAELRIKLAALPFKLANDTNGLTEEFHHLNHPKVARTMGSTLEQ